MNYKFINKHLPENIHTEKGHLNQEQKHLQLTKTLVNDILTLFDSEIKDNTTLLKAKTYTTQSLAVCDLDNFATNPEIFDDGEI